MQVRIPNNGCYHHYFSISILAILILYKTAEQSYFHITQKHGSNIKFSNTEQCKNPIPRTWNTKPVMLLLSEDVEDHFRVVFSWQTYPAWDGLASMGRCSLTFHNKMCISLLLRHILTPAIDKRSLKKRKNHLELKKTYTEQTKLCSRKCSMIITPE